MPDELLPIDDTPVLDRSTLETWAECPRRAALSRDIKSASLIAATGTEVHDAIRQTLDSFVGSGGALSRRDLVDETTNNLYGARPDVQPDVIAAAKYAIWGFADILANIHYTAVMRYDGGTGNLSGQLTMDIAAGCRVTGAVDLLLATASKQVVELWDWKTGYKRWTEADVSQSFQFQMYAALVLDHYPDVECVRTRIFNTRTNSPTYSVDFTREKLPQYRARISHAAGLWWQHHKQPADKVPAWPARDKCDTCPVIARCTAADADLREVDASPSDLLATLSHLEMRSKAIAKRLAVVVQRTGQDVRTDDGTCFGFGKPKADRKPTAAMYVAGKATEEA